MGNRGRVRRAHRLVLLGLLAQHALGDAGVMEETLVAFGMVLPAAYSDSTPLYKL
ncbi:hypothetical protein PCA10_22740 [Metapseudomonas resinovorans NBRC 106553]|uniref:Uncharacterized protein n=1 Tax=Metapseudomonas resinovorans NBRC 106553 TaxID=1245471 RepID=S6AUL8_METRE|nr:hypothetical protein PCA10_22740 [Pseudomonas resinovorans NBRC 106553]